MDCVSGEFDPVANGLTRVNAPIGDLDADGVVNASDIDALTQRIQRGDDVNHFALESYRNGWIIRDLRRDDFVYLSVGLSTHDALADLGVNAIQLFDGGSELARNRQLATLRKPTEQNAPWLEPMFDLNADGAVDINDREMLISDVLGVRSGDTNFDGFVNSEDLGILLNSFGTSDGRGWESGNFNTDTTIDSADLGLLLNNFDPSGSIASVVPEPHYGYILVGSWLFGIGLQARRRIW